MRKYINKFLDFVITKYSFISLAVQGLFAGIFLICCIPTTIGSMNFFGYFFVGIFTFYYFSIPYLIFTFFIIPILFIKEYKDRLEIPSRYVIENRFLQFILLISALIAVALNLFLWYCLGCLIFEMFLEIIHGEGLVNPIGLFPFFW